MPNPISFAAPNQTSGGILGANSTAGAIGQYSPTAPWNTSQSSPLPAVPKGPPSPLAVSSATQAISDSQAKTNFFNTQSQNLQTHQQSLQNTGSPTQSVTGTPSSSNTPSSSTQPAQTSPSSTPQQPVSSTQNPALSSSVQSLISQGYSDPASIAAVINQQTGHQFSAQDISAAMGQPQPGASSVGQTFTSADGGNTFTQGVTTPTQPGATSSTGSAALDQEQSQTDQYNQQATQAYNTFAQGIQQIQNGTFPLSSSQQSQISSIQATFQQSIQQQIAANNQYTAGVNEANIVSGRSRYAPEVAMSQIQSAVNLGLQKIGALNVQMTQAVTTAQAAIDKDNLDELNTQYEAFTKLNDDRQAELDKLASATQSYQQFQQTYALDLQKESDLNQQNAIDNQFKQSQQDISKASLTGVITNPDGTTTPTLESTKDALDAANAAATQKIQLAQTLGYWTNPDGTKISTQQAIKDAQDAQNQAANVAATQDKNAIDAANDGLTKNPDGTYSSSAGINLGASGNLTPTQLGNLTYVHTLASGGMYFDRSELPKGAQGDAIAAQYAALGIPQVPDATTRTALDAVDTATQNISSLKSAIDGVAPSGLLGQIGEAIKNPISQTVHTDRGNALDNVNALRQVMFQAITSLSGTKRIMPAELAQMQQNVPGANDTKAQADAKLAALTTQISNARKSLLGNKVIYTNLSDYTRDNPVPPAEQKTTAQMHADGVSDDQIMQWLQQQAPSSGSSGFNSVPSTTQNGSLSGARTDRNNNPTAMTTDVAKEMGLIEGKDYVNTGDVFDGGKLATAKLLGDPISTTIKAIDNGGFQTASGKPHWSYINMPKSQWDAMSYAEKKTTVQSMYKHEGGSALNKYFA